MAALSTRTIQVTSFWTTLIFLLALLAVSVNAYAHAHAHAHAHAQRPEWQQRRPTEHPHHQRRQYSPRLLSTSKQPAPAPKEEDSSTVTDGASSCQFASLKCSYRSGCGSTLQSYIIECHDLIKNKTNTCSERCKNTLVGLTSTPEGKRLMECDCADDLACLETRLRLQTCRASVLYATRQDTVVSCDEARWICQSDAECAKALEYYHLLCQAMFRGRVCTERCKNSLAILRRQRQAAKLAECRCGSESPGVNGEEEEEEYKCADVKRHMEELCEEKKEEEMELDNVVEVDEGEEQAKEKGDEDKGSAVTVTSRSKLMFAIALVMLAVIC